MGRKTKQSEAITEVIVRYDLHELPTAQHKAGLAGLLLQIENMSERRARGADLPLPPTVVDKGPTFAEVRFTAESMQALFDDLYDAALEDVVVLNKWSGASPKEVRQVEVPQPDGKIKTEKRYVYEVVRPAGHFLSQYTDNGKEVWLKLWRDMLWAIPRARPTTRGAFKARAEGELTKEGADAWKDLVAHESARKKGGVKTIEIASAILLGAQAVSAESVTFEDGADHALLLHFWQLTARIFVPEQIDADGKWQLPSGSFVLAIPEMSDLDEFIHAFKRSLTELRSEKRGYRPADTIIALPDEGALAFMHQLDRLVTARALTRRPPAYLFGVEFFHMLKRGNNVKTVTHGRVPAWDHLLTKYDGLMSRDGPKNPIMLAGRLKALLNDQPWFAALSDDLVEREWSWFVHSKRDGHLTPPAMRGFAYEALKQFGRLSQQERPMTETHDPKAVDHVVYRLVRQYVHEKAATRMGVDPADRAATHQPSEKDSTKKRETAAYQEERRHVAASLFLALRSRHGADFVEHFTATLGSVAQYLPENDYVILTAALMRTFTSDQGENRPRTHEDVKTLTLLALSAHSRSLTAGSSEPEAAEPVLANKEQ